MELEDTLKFRHNTVNRTYGFEQKLNQAIDEKPTKAAGQIPDGDYPYKFTVAGNYK